MVLSGKSSRGDETRELDEEDEEVKSIMSLLNNGLILVNIDYSVPNDVKTRILIVIRAADECISL